MLKSFLRYSQRFTPTDLISGTAVSPEPRHGGNVTEIKGKIVRKKTIGSFNGIFFIVKTELEVVLENKNHNPII